MCQRKWKDCRGTECTYVLPHMSYMFPEKVIQIHPFIHLLLPLFQIHADFEQKVGC